MHSAVEAPWTRARELAVSLLDRAAFYIARLWLRVEVYEGMRFMDARGLKMPDQVWATLTNAIKTLRLGGSEFEELVRTELQMVIAVPGSRRRISTGLRAYYSPFTGPERSNSQLLAGNLVWAATVLRARTKARHERCRFDPAAAWRAAQSRRRDLMSLLPNAERWLEYLRDEDRATE